MNRYPLYSQADQANWMLGQIYENAANTTTSPAQYYARIVKDYPLSPLAAPPRRNWKSLARLFRRPILPHSPACRKSNKSAPAYWHHHDGVRGHTEDIA